MIDKNEVKRIAKLARLGITPEEEEKFLKDFSSILDYFKMLEELDVSNVEPTFHSAEELLKEKKDKMRQDAGKDSGLSDTLVDSAPEKEKKHVKVKAVF